MREPPFLPTNWISPEKLLKIPSRSINLWPEVVPCWAGADAAVSGGETPCSLGRSCESHPPHDCSMENPWSLDWARTLCWENPWEGQNSRGWALSAIQSCSCWAVKIKLRVLWQTRCSCSKPDVCFLQEWPPWLDFALKTRWFYSLKMWFPELGINKIKIRQKSRFVVFLFYFYFKTQMRQSFVALWGLQITKPLEVVWVLILLFWVCGVLSCYFRRCKWEDLRWVQHFVRKNFLFVWSWTFSLCGGQGRRSFAKKGWSTRQNSWKELWCSHCSRGLLRMWFHFENLLPRKSGAPRKWRFVFRAAAAFMFILTFWPSFFFGRNSLNSQSIPNGWAGTWPNTRISREFLNISTGFCCWGAVLVLVLNIEVLIGLVLKFHL